MEEKLWPNKAKNLAHNADSKDRVLGNGWPNDFDILYSVQTV